MLYLIKHRCMTLRDCQLLLYAAETRKPASGGLWDGLGLLLGRGGCVLAIKDRSHHPSGWNGRHPKRTGRVTQNCQVGCQRCAAEADHRTDDKAKSLRVLAFPGDFNLRRVSLAHDFKVAALGRHIAFSDHAL